MGSIVCGIKIDFLFSSRTLVLEGILATTSFLYGWGDRGWKKKWMSTMI